MKKTLFVGILACLIFSQSSFAQITSESLVGQWGLVDYDMAPKKTNGKLTAKEEETVTAMRMALSLKPDLMKFTLNEDGTTLLEPNPDNLVSTWQYSESVLTLKTGGKAEQYTVTMLPDNKVEWKALKSKVALPIMTLQKEMETDLHTYTFTNQPRNPDFRFAGKPFLVEGSVVAEYLYDEGKSLYFATKRSEYNDILLTYLSLNTAGEALGVRFVYISEEQSKDLYFGVLTDDESLDISIDFDTFLSETINENVADKVESQISGIFIRQFKTTKELEDFKKFLKRD
jgi:hypothetical protein